MKLRFRIFCASVLTVGVLLAGCGGGGLFSSDATRPEVRSDELQFQTPADGTPTAILTTSKGVIKMVLYEEYAPQAVQNFIGLVNQGYYNGLSFHRIVTDFIVQTGDASGTGTGGATIWNNTPYPVEISDQLHHYSGAVSMAHAGDSDENMSQFFIVATPSDSVDKDFADKLTELGVRSEVVQTYRDGGGAPYLDNLNTVFGQIYSGMDVVDAICSVPVSDDGTPSEDVILESVTIGSYSAAEESAAAQDGEVSDSGAASDASVSSAAG